MARTKMNARKAAGGTAARFALPQEEQEVESASGTPILNAVAEPLQATHISNRLKRVTVCAAILSHSVAKLFQLEQEVLLSESNEDLNEKKQKVHDNNLPESDSEAFLGIDFEDHDEVCFLCSFAASLMFNSDLVLLHMLRRCF